MILTLTGRFDPEYNRTKILIRGLNELGVETRILPFVRKRNADRKKIKAEIESSDWIFMPSFTHNDVPFIRKLSKRPMVFDPLISRYLSKVFDYQSISKYSPRAYKNFLKDSRSLKRADLILADTELHREYYINKFKIPAEKIKVIPVGVINDDFYPLKSRTDEPTTFRVGFYGSFIPLHGIDIILNAAEKLMNDKSVSFRIAGAGMLFEKMQKFAAGKKLTNVRFTGYIAYPSLNKEINNFDVALGIFGSSLKAGMVVPNKLFHYAACDRAVISMHSNAVNKVFTHGKNIHLCAANGDELAEAILYLKDNHEYRKKLGKNAGQHIRENYNEKRIAAALVDHLKNYQKLRSSE